MLVPRLLLEDGGSEKIEICQTGGDRPDKCKVSAIDDGWSYNILECCMSVPFFSFFADCPGFHPFYDQRVQSQQMVGTQFYFLASSGILTDLSHVCLLRIIEVSICLDAASIM